LSRDSQGGVLKLSRFGLPRLWEIITFCSDLQLGWGLKQTCSSPQELSNGVFHSTCTHRGRVDSQLLVVGSQTASLIPNIFFCHNLYCKCPNGPCEAIFDIYTLIDFQWYKKNPNARCFDPCNRTLKFRESRRTPKSPFREFEFHPHILSRRVTTKTMLWTMPFGIHFVHETWYCLCVWCFSMELIKRCNLWWHHFHCILRQWCNWGWDPITHFIGEICVGHHHAWV